MSSGFKTKNSACRREEKSDNHEESLTSPPTTKQGISV